MKFLVLGAGLQGRAAIYDLIFCPEMTAVIVADQNEAALDRVRRELGDERMTCVPVDAQYHGAVAALLAPGMAVIHLLPPEFRPAMARLAVENGCHFVDASYTHPAYVALHALAIQNDVAILPEFGLDPGLDLLLAVQAVKELDEVHQFRSYGAGIPAPEADDNPLHYKISWSWPGVLRSYTRPARTWQDGRAVEIPAGEIFDPAHRHTLQVEGLGALEAFPNGDVVPYLEALGLAETCAQAGRYTLRWPGHVDFWRVLAHFGFLNDAPVTLGAQTVAPLDMVRDLLGPQLQYRPHEADIALVRVEVAGRKAGRPLRVVYQVLDQRDPATNLLAMQRTVGFTASIGAQMILRGDIPARGVLSPLRDVPARMVFSELDLRDITVRRFVFEG